MPTLYVLESESRLEKEYGRLLVTREDEVLLRVPIKNVSSVVLIGTAGVTTQALQALLAQNTPLFLVRRSGELLGELIPPAGFNLPLRQAQYRRNDEPTFALDLAREIVAGKIHNQAVLAKRLVRRRRSGNSGKLIKPDEDSQENDWVDSLAQMERAETAARACSQMDAILGIEGNAAGAYFELFRMAFDPCWKFTKRTRRPPRDPVNALLSLGYTFLGHAMTAALQVVGLDPFLGYFHQEEYGRPALALDLIEEFRAPLVDSLALTLVKKRLLQEHDFESGGNGGVYLTRAGMRVFVREFCDRLESCVTPRSIGRPLSYRKLFEVQARSLANLILGKSSVYRPFQAR
jgi:CRISP-associated protein Cas1